MWLRWLGFTWLPDVQAACNSAPQGQICCVSFNTSADLLPYIKYFGLPTSGTCPVYGNVNDEENLPLVSVSKDFHLFCKFRMMFMWTETIEKSVCCDWEFSFIARNELTLPHWYRSYRSNLTSSSCYSVLAGPVCPVSDPVLLCVWQDDNDFISIALFRGV